MIDPLWFANACGFLLAALGLTLIILLVKGKL